MENKTTFLKAVMTALTASTGGPRCDQCPYLKAKLIHYTAKTYNLFSYLNSIMTAQTAPNASLLKSRSLKKNSDGAIGAIGAVLLRFRCVIQILVSVINNKSFTDNDLSVLNPITSNSLWSLPRTRLTAVAPLRTLHLLVSEKMEEIIRLLLCARRRTLAYRGI